MNPVTAPATCPPDDFCRPVTLAARISASSSRSVWLNGGAAVVESAGKIISANDTLAVWLGATPGELIGQCLPALLAQHHAEWEQPLRDFLQRIVLFDRTELVSRSDHGQQRLSVELCCQGEVRFLRFESALPPQSELEDAFHGETWSRAVAHKLFHRLLRAEAQLHNLSEHWPGIIFSQRPDFSFAFVSPKIEELTGVPAAEWQRQTRGFWQVIHEADAEALQRWLADLGTRPPSLRSGAARDSELGTDLTSTFRIRHAQTGRVRYLWEHRQAVRSRNGLLLGYEGIWLDITRQTLAERRLLTMSWKESLGTLTMGLAHDFCNVMTGIVSLSDTFEEEFAGSESARSGLTLIRSTAGQAVELARRIRQLHQGAPGEKNYHDLNEVISSIGSVLQKVLTRRVRIAVENAAAQLPIYVDAVELQQVIVNLALNAVDAMPNGGALTFKTERVEAPPPEAALQGRMPRGPLVCLSVQDTGVGIPPRHLAKIFDPFFTTKPLGRGSGLGLYNARLFVENHNAAITVTTGETGGTTFRLWFAQSDFCEAEAAKESAPSVRSALLLYGQSAAKLDGVVDLLREEGWYVMGVTSQVAALEALHSPDYHFNGVLLLGDGPWAEGLSLLHRVRGENLPVKVFLSCGGCNPDDVQTRLLEGVDAMFAQDLPLNELLARLKAELAQPRAPI